MVGLILLCLAALTSYGMLCEKIDTFGSVDVTIKLNTKDIKPSDIELTIMNISDQSELWKDTVANTDSLAKYGFRYTNAMHGALDLSVILDSTLCSDAVDDSFQVANAQRISYTFTIAQSWQDIPHGDKQYLKALTVGSKTDTIFYSKTMTAE